MIIHVSEIATKHVIERSVRKAARMIHALGYFAYSALYPMLHRNVSKHVSLSYIYVFKYGTYTHTHIYIHTYRYKRMFEKLSVNMSACQTHVFTGVNTWSAHISVDTDVHFFANKYVTTNVSRNVRLLVFNKTILMECIAQNEVIVLTSGSMKTLADEGGGPQIVILPMTHGCQYFVK